MDAKREMILSVGLAVAQAAAQLTDYVPAKHKPLLLLAHVAIAEIRKQRAFRFNPDGTRAQVAYEAPAKHQRPPYQIGVLALLCALLWPASGIAQTRATVEQMAGPAAPAARVLVVLPNGTVAIADLGTGVVLDTSGPVPVLRAAVQAAATAADVTLKPTGTLGAYTIPHTPEAASLDIYRNGLLLTAGEDYTVAGAVVTFRAGGEPRAGDLVRVRYRYRP